MTPVRTLSDKFLARDFCESSHELVRELAMACRKAAIYGAGHPMSKQAAEKPFLELEHLFRYRRYVLIALANGNLFAMNFRLKESVFTGEIIRYLQLHEIRTLLFERSLTAGEFTRFLDHFVKRVNPNDPASALWQKLRQEGVASIEINSETGFRIHEEFKQYRGDVVGDFSARTIIQQTLGDDPHWLADVLTRGSDALDTRLIDFDLDIVNYLLPERIAMLRPTDLRASVESLLRERDQRRQAGQEADAVESRIRSFRRLTDYHPDKEQIFSGLELHAEATSASARPTAGIDTVRRESTDLVSAAIASLKEAGGTLPERTVFVSACRRLLKTGQRGAAIEAFLKLIDLLESQDQKTRQTALDFLLGSLDTLDTVTDLPVVQDVVQRMADKISWKDESLELAAVMSALFLRLAANKEYRLMTQLSGALTLRRSFSDGVTVYDSVAIKQVYDSFNRPEMISTFIDDMVQGDNATATTIRTLLSHMGNDEAARALAEIISHPIRGVRQHALKILAELGPSTLTVFSRLLANDTMFQRPAERRELADANWYVVRNAIFVLGSLRDPRCVQALRIRISDPDIRVRREIVSAMEKIGGSESVDLLALMADDTDRDIREAVIMSLGVIGQRESVPVLVDIAHRHPDAVLRIVPILGKLGGETARGFLARLWNDSESSAEFFRMAGAPDDLHIAIARALRQIGDDEAIASIKQFSERFSATQRLFSKLSPLQRTLADLLSK